MRSSSRLAINMLYQQSKKKPHTQPNYSLTPSPSPNGEGSEDHCLQIRESLSPNPSPNGEGSENHCLQMKGAFLWCKERLSWIGRNALLHLRRAFPSFYSFLITIRVPMLLCLNNMSFKNMSLCPYVLNIRYQAQWYYVSMSKKYVIKKICHCVILSKKLCYSVFPTR